MSYVDDCIAQAHRLHEEAVNRGDRPACICGPFDHREDEVQANRCAACRGLLWDPASRSQDADHG